MINNLLEYSVPDCLITFKKGNIVAIILRKAEIIFKQIFIYKTNILK